MKAKNTEKIKELYEQHASKLFPVAKRYSPDNTIAQQIITDVFIHISPYKKRSLKNLSLYPKEISFYEIKQLIIQKSIERKDPPTHVPLPEVRQDKQSDALSREEMIEIMQFLPRKERVVFNLSVIDMATTRDIAALLSTTTTDIESTMESSRTHIKKILGTVN